MKPFGKRSPRSAARTVLLVACAAASVLAIAVRASAVTTVTVTSVAPTTIKADSAQVTVFGVDLQTTSGDTLTGAKVKLNNVLGFTTGDLAGKSGATSAQGVQLWRDSSTAGANQDVLDSGDTPVSTGWTEDGDCALVPTCTATFTMASTAIPGAAEGSYTFLIAVRTSNTIADGNTFTVEVTPDSFTTSPSPTIAPATTTPSIIADTLAPAAPTVSALGLSKAAGKVRVGGTAVSGENPGVLEVYRDDDATCASPTYVTESGSINLTQTNADLVGTNSSQTTALQGFPTATETVCYRVRDAAGNPSDYSIDGLVPAAPSAADVALLGSSNVSDLKRITAQPDASPGRTFRLYLRPGGSGLERAKDQNLVTPTFVQVTTGSTVADSGTTNIRQFGNNDTLAAGDGIAYARVNANGNSGPVTDDGTVPAVPSSGDLGLLSTSAVEGHQRIVADPDATPGRTFGLYLDPAGLTTWELAVTTSDGTTPVRVTTAAGSAASATTTVFAGPDALTSGFATGFVRVDANGNESGVGSNGSIPTAPVAADITFSDALNNFVVNPFPAGAPPLAVQIGVYAGSTPSTAYDGTPEGVATSSTPASVGELASGQNLYYSAVNTTTGNESPLTADGSIPAAPGGTDIGLLWTSAAEGHRRVVAAADASQPRTFRLYLDTAGGTTWVRATTLSNGTIPVEVTTSNAQTGSGTTTVFAGATALSNGHAVGYAIVVGGNDSDATADGLIPAGPATATTSVSDALNQFTATAATAALNVNLHYNGVGDPAATAYNEAGPKATASSSSPVSIAELAAGTTLFYTRTDTANGNESPIVDDGDIPASPTGDMTLLGVSAATGHQRVTASADSVSRTFRLYLDPAGGAAWTRASTSSGGSTPVEITTSTGSSAASPTTTIFSGTTQLGDGFAVGHALRSAAGNDSDVAADGAIPAAPAAGTTSATAAIDDVTATSATATDNVHVYKSTSADPAIAYDGSPDVVLDADPTKDLDTAAGDRLYYTMFDTTTNNESTTSADGAIPAAPNGANSSASAATDSFVVPDATATNNVKIFLHTSATPATAYGNGTPTYTATSSPWQGANLPSNQYVHLTALDTASGNESAITTDGSIPAPPSGADGVMSASAAEYRISSSNDSTSRTLRLHADPAGGTAYVQATTTAGGSAPVEVTTNTTGSVTSAEGIYLNGSPLAAGASIAYTRILEGNESDYLTDGTIPSAPAGVANFSADAADQTSTVAAAAAGGTYRVFRGTTAASSRTAHSSGTPTTITTTGLIAGDTIGYAITSGGNESPILADGTIPIAPGIALQTASDTGRSNVDALTKDATPTFDVTALSGATVTLYEGSTTHTSGTADSNGDIALTATTLADGAHTIKAKTTVGGNTSPGSGPVTVTVDTAAPATPGAPDLAAASDSGSSQTDNITNDTTPTFDVVVEANADALLLNGATQVASGLADGAGAASLTSPAVADGGHAFGVKAEDAAGNVSALSPTLNVTVDTVAPGSSPAGVLQTASDTGRSATDSITADSTPSLDVTGADAGASLVLREGNTTLGSATADGSGNATLTSSVLSDGSHDLTVSATDVAGNLSPASSPTTVTIDTVAPAAPAAPALTSDTGRSATDRITSATTPTFSVTTESVAEVELVEGATVLGSAIADGAGAAAVAVSSALGDGVHSISVRATDVAGNASGLSAATDVTIDTTAPAAPAAPDLDAASDTGPSSTDNITNDVTPAFVVTVEANAEALLSAGATQVGSQIADGSGAATVTSAPLNDATHSLTVKAVDVAGNTSAASPALEVTIDTVAPAAPSGALASVSDTGRSASDGVTSDTTPDIGVSGAVAGGTLTLYEGATALATGTADGSGNATLTSSALGEGSHDLTVTGTDLAGNASAASQPVTLVVDTAAPDAPATPTLTTDTGRSALDNVTADATPAFSVAAEGLAEVELVEGATVLGSGVADAQGASAPVVGSTLTDGSHSIAARAIDVAGNVSLASSAVSVIIDTTAPAAPAAAPDLIDSSDTGSSATDDITADSTPTFDVVVEADADALVFAADTQVGTALADGAGNARATASTLTDGAHLIGVKAVDAAGNVSSLSPTLQVTIDTVAPADAPLAVLQAASDTGRSAADGVTSDAAPVFDITGADPGASLKLHDGAVEIAAGTADSNGNATLMSDPLGDGSHDIVVSSFDVAGNASSAGAPVTVVVDTQAPEAPGVPSLATDTGRSLTDNITNATTPAFTVATEPFASAEIVQNGTSLGSAIADGAGTASPAVAQSAALSDGVHSVTARATDVAGNVSVESAALNFTVDATAPAAPASIDLVPSSDTGSSDADDLTGDATPSFTVVFAEPDAMVTLYAGGVAQADTPAGDASLTVTADTLTDGVHQMTATVSDVAGNESVATTALPVTIDTVAPATPAAPDLDPASDTGSSGVDDVTGDTTPTFNLAGGEPGSTLTLLEGSTVLGTGIVNGSGDASVTSSALADGLHSVAWKATDAAGNVSALSPPLSIRIDTGVPSVVLTTTSVLTGTFKAVFSEDVSPVNNTNVVLRVVGTSTNLPASVTYHAGSRTATLKPTAPLIAGQLYQLIVGPPGSTKPTDDAGSQVAETAATVRASLIEQENSAGSKSQWGVVANSGAYGGSYTAARLSGATASFSFTGNAVTWYTMLAPDQGKARVLVDGVLKGEFDNYRSVPWVKFPRTISGLSNGSHTITVVVLGSKHASAKNTLVTVDAFKVGSTLYEHWHHANQWQAVAASGASGKRYARSDVASASHYFTFRGTGVDWMTMYGPNMGKAAVYIDGAYKGTFDNWSSSYRYAQVRSFRGLSDSVHTIRIVVLGQKRSGATGTFVVVDRFNVV